MKIDDEDLNGYLMYPKVFLDYMERHLTYGPVRTLPTKTFFYGMNPGDEISLEIDPGKTLEIRLQAIGETDENGEVKVVAEQWFPTNCHQRLLVFFANCPPSACRTIGIARSL